MPHHIAESSSDGALRAELSRSSALLSVAAVTSTFALGLAQRPVVAVAAGQPAPLGADWACRYWEACFVLGAYSEQGCDLGAEMA